MMVRFLTHAQASLLTDMIHRSFQLRTDMALSTDKEFKPYAQKYAKDEDAFFSDFSKAFSKCVSALLSLLLPS